MVLATPCAPAELWLDAAPCLVSLLIVAFVVPTVRAEPGGRRQAGWRFVRGDGWMRPVTAAHALSQGACGAAVRALGALSRL